MAALRRLLQAEQMGALTVRSASVQSVEGRVQLAACRPHHCAEGRVELAGKKCSRISMSFPKDARFGSTQTTCTGTSLASGGAGLAGVTCGVDQAGKHLAEQVGTTGSRSDPCPPCLVLRLVC